MKCKTCLEDKKPEEFSWKKQSKGIRNKECKKCKADYNRNWYKNNKKRHIKNVRKSQAKTKIKLRKYLFEYFKEHPCVDCGETDPIVLSFDHIKGEKFMDVSAMVSWCYSLVRIKKEIDICCVRCVNCHTRKTAKEKGWDKIYDFDAS